MSSRAMAVTCLFLELYEQKVTRQSIRACKVSKKNTLGEEHVKGGVTAVLPLKLGQQHNAEAAKLLSKMDKMARHAKAAKAAKSGEKEGGDAE